MGGRLVFLVLVAGLVVAMALSMVFARDAEAKKKNKKKKKAPPPTSIQVPIPQTPVSQAPGTTFHQPPTNVYKGDYVARAWGLNGSGQLGDGTTTNRTTPVQVNNLSGVKAIAGGREYSLALKEDGTVWAWGDNEYGQVGNGTTTNRTTPVQVGNQGNVKAIAAGEDHSLAKVLNPPVNTQ